MFFRALFIYSILCLVVVISAGMAKLGPEELLSQVGTMPFFRQMAASEQNDRTNLGEEEGCCLPIIFHFELTGGGYTFIQDKRAGLECSFKQRNVQFSKIAYDLTHGRMRFDGNPSDEMTSLDNTPKDQVSLLLIADKQQDATFMYAFNATSCTCTRTRYAEPRRPCLKGTKTRTTVLGMDLKVDVYEHEQEQQDDPKSAKIPIDSGPDSYYYYSDRAMVVPIERHRQDGNLSVCIPVSVSSRFGFKYTDAREHYGREYIVEQFKMSVQEALFIPPGDICPKLEDCPKFV